jgi:DNA topoisomerase-1
LEKGDQINENIDIIKQQHFTSPPAYYNEASLIKTMENLGIGRPSTYSTITSRIIENNYVTLDQKKIIITPQGKLCNERLQFGFANFINEQYTSQMESDLDKIAIGELDFKS